MLEKETIEINESNKLIFLKYTNKLKQKFDKLECEKTNSRQIDIDVFIEQIAQKFPLETDKFIITSNKEKIHDNNIKDSICFSENFLFKELQSFINHIINNPNSEQKKIELIMQTNEENTITSFYIRKDCSENYFTHQMILLNIIAFKNVNQNKLDEIKDWFNEITRCANQIIDSKDKLPDNSKLTSESTKDIQNPSNIEKNSYDKIKECIAKINSPNKISSLFYIIKKQIKEKNIRVNNNFEIERLYNTSREIEDTIEFLKKLNNDSNLIQDQNDREIFKKIHNYINSLSEKDLLIKVLGNIVEKASSILDVMKKNVEHMTLGQLIKKEDLDLNKLKTIMNSSTEHFFNKEKTKKPEEIIDNNKRTSEKNEFTSEKNECTSKKRMIGAPDCYEPNKKKSKNDKNDLYDKSSTEKNQLGGYSEEKSTEVNNKTNEVHSKLKLGNYYIYPRFRDKKVAKDPK